MNRKLVPNIGYVMWWRGTGGREPGRKVGSGREAGGGGTGCGSHARAGGRRRMKGIKFFNDFLVCF